MNTNNNENDMIEFHKMNIACDELINASNDINNAKKGDIIVYKKVALALLNLKSSNRKVHNTIETKKKEVENYKDKVDRLQLQLENLLYKKAYLKNQIKVCKDLDTPNLTIIENLTNSNIALKKFPKKNNNNDDINIIFNEQIEKSKHILNKEMEDRIALQKILDDESSNLQNHVDLFDKKRKLIDSIPEKLEVVKLSTKDIYETIKQAKNTNLITETIISETEEMTT